MSRKPLLIYHGGCPDGFGAAYAFWVKYGDSIEYIPLSHKPLPFKGLDKSVFENRKVWMVDVALEREDAIIANECADEFLIIDHHISAKNDLEGLDFCHFDINHSGAILGWNYCFPNEEPPMLLRYIEDRDIHKWTLPYVEEILTAIDSQEKTFSSWKRLERSFSSTAKLEALKSEGAGILRYNKILIKQIKKESYFGMIKGYRVPIINTPFFRSEIVNELAEEGHPFAAGYHYNGESYIFSLRSCHKSNGLDVTEISSQFVGGGGHKNASGFSIKDLKELE